MTKNQRWQICGESVSIEGREGFVISASNTHIEVCWKVSEAMGEESEVFDLLALPESFELLTAEAPKDDTGRRSERR